MSDNDEVPGDVLKSYRAANAVLQEQASPATRAAILAAAACADAARPRAHSVPSPAARDGWRSWLVSRNALGRLPVAAMATVLVSVLAWQIAQFAPGREDVVHSAAPLAPASAPAQTVETLRRDDDKSRADVASNDIAQERAVRAGPGGAGKIAGRESSNTADVPLASSATDARVITTTRANAVVAETARPLPAERPSAQAGANEAEAARQPSVSAEIAGAKMLSSPKSEAPSDEAIRTNRSLRPRDGGSSESGSSGRMSGNIASEVKPARPGASSAARVRAEPVERSAPVAGDDLAAESSAPLDLDRWVARIVQLRRDRRDAEADAELKQLRARYPDAKLPPGVARNPIGTQ